MSAARNLCAHLAVWMVTLIGGTVALAQAAPDAFYLALLRDGKSEMLRGDAVAAKKSLRLACFGFLEQPVLLAEGLVRLGLAEAALNDREAFTATFTRLAEVEERFAAYAPAALSADERKAFEIRAVEWIAPEALRSLPTFAQLVARKSEVDLSKLSPRDRGRELEKRSAADSTNPHWKFLLAQEEAAEERWAKAIGRLEGVPDGAENGAAGCLRGQALARLKRCEEALVPLAACASSTSDAQLAEARLGCLLTLDRDEAARAFAAQVVRPASEAPTVRKAIARIPAPTASKASAPEKSPAANSPAEAPLPEPANSAKAVKPAQGKVSLPAKEESPKPAPASTQSSAPKAPAAAPPPSSGSKPSSKPDSGKLTSEEERLVAQAHEMLKSVENRDELRHGFALVQPVADRRAGRADLQLLTGEIAYRAGLWSSGAEYFRRSTPGGGGPVDPTLRFYYAVCLYESGDFPAAALVASTGLEKLQRPPFVEGYLTKIRAAKP